MRFQATHKLVTYLLVLAAFATLASARALPAPVLLGFLALAAASWRAEPGGRLAALVDRAALPARVAVGALFVVTAWASARRLPEPDLRPALELVLFMLALKLFHRRDNRDDVHVFVLSFLLVLAAAALGGTVLFAPGFVAYVLVATWALVLYHLRREMEENYLVKHSAQAPSQKVGIARILASRRVVGGAFFVATGVVAVGVAAGAIATFALVPRVGAGFVLGAPRAAATLIGFSDDVTLGSYGTLSTDNPTVALRATVPRIAALPTVAARERAVDALYWRGTVYDSYDRGHWTRSRGAALRTVLTGVDRRVLVGEAQDPDNDDDSGDDATAGDRDARVRAARVDRQEIDVVGLSAPVAFALDRPIAYEVPAPRAGSLAELQMEPRWAGEVALRLVPPGAGPVGDGSDGDAGRSDLRTPPNIHYVAESVSGSGLGGPVHAAAPLSPGARAAYLALPPAMAPRLEKLALELAGPPDGRHPAATIAAVTNWLRATHEYTLQLPRPTPGVDPVESFLDDTPAGHCEYFASATALLLRAAGIPTRYVNGYLGGEWNEVGHYVAVRDNRAHSWVEAYLSDPPGAGWTRVDSTPPLRTMARAGHLGQLFDSLDFRWSRWVVGYDLGHQLDLVRGLARHAGLHAPEAPARGVPWWVLVVVAVAAVAAAATRLGPARAPARIFGRPARVTALPVQRLYDRALARLAQAGLPRRAAETPREYAARVAARGLDPAAMLAELTEVYAAARFGGRAVDRDVLDRLARRLATLGGGARATAG